MPPAASLPSTRKWLMARLMAPPGSLSFSSRVTGGTDQYFVDGVVNAVAAFIMRLMSPLFRAAQTGFTQNYALVMVLGLVAAVAMFFGADILGWIWKR